VNCKDCIVGSLCVFTEKIRSILENKLTLIYSKNEVILESGQAANGIFCTMEGKVKIMSHTPDGMVLVGFAGAGDLIGLSQLSLSKNGYFAAIAMENTRGCFITTENFRTLLDVCDKDFSQQIIAQLVKKSRDSEKLFGYMSGKRSVVKFCGLLKEMIYCFGLNSKNELEVALTIGEWAELANLQRETLQRMKKQLENAGILKWGKNSIGILSASKLDEILLKGKLNSKK